MKTLKYAALILTCIIAPQLHAAAITNGDFATCDFSGWQKDTDGFGDPGATNDFFINNDAGDCSAAVNIDVATGATSLFANTLFSDLDLSTNLNQQVQLSFDWDFSGFDDQTLDADTFFVALREGSTFLGEDGSAGFLIDPTSIYGSGSFSALLDSSFNNLNNITLDFTVQGGFGFTQTNLSSMLVIDNVMLSAVNASVPEPGTLGVFALGIAGLAFRKRK